MSRTDDNNHTTTYAYDDDHRLTTATYDRAGRLTAIDYSDATPDVTFGYDNAGRRTSMTDGAGTETRGYDNADRLTSVCHAATCGTGSTNKTTWTYDRIGNRLTETTGTSTRTYAYNNADQLTSSALGGTTTSYSYDANGNQTAAGADAFTYDTAGHMTTATVGADTHNYAYDGDGKRLQTTTVDGTGTTVTHAEWDTTQTVPEIAAERDATGTVTRGYTYGLDRLTTAAGGTTSVYLHDALGSVTNMTDTNGAKQWTYDYEPFGTVKTTTKDNNQAVAQPIRFADEQLDGSGLYHLRARQYDSTTGRFTATDPLTPDIDDPYVGSYVYVNQRPGVLVDPTGEKGRSVGSARCQVCANFASGLMNSALFNTGEPVERLLGIHDKVDHDSSSRTVGEIAGLLIPTGALMKGARTVLKVDKAVDATRGTRAPQAARSLNLPFRDAGLRSQVDDVVRHFDEFGTPPTGVAQGGLKGYPKGTYGGQGLPQQPLGYYTESDVWVSGGGIKRGTERLVFGRGGEVYYTPTHYNDFIRIR